MAPNPMKVALFLEEADIAYEAIPIDGRKGDQFDPEFLKINPNAKVPAIVDDGNAIFDSNAILLYLAEKTGKFLPADSLGARGELLSWLMFIASGIGPFSGQAIHFKQYAPEQMPYSINRYDFEASRHYEIIENRLEKHPYMLGEEYTIVDMCIWGWARLLPRILGEDALSKFSHIKLFVEKIQERKATERALSIDERNGHIFKTEMDRDACDFMFPQNKRL